jgi:hypothetical protein
MSSVNITEREPILESRSQAFLRGIHYVDMKGVARAIGFRIDIQDFIDSADDETGYFLLRDVYSKDEGVIKEVFYSASPHPTFAVKIRIPWRKFIEEGKPDRLEIRTNYYAPERK